MNRPVTSQNEAVSGASAAVAGPGNLLRQARLDLRLAPEDVANILHLAPRQIVALEDDDYDNLAGPTYVRGYLRGYAQLLGLPAEPVVEAYNRVVAANKPVDLGKLAPPREIGSDHQLIKIATAAVLVLVLGMSVLWWREQERPVAPPSTTEPTSPTSIAENPDAAEESAGAPVATTGLRAPAATPPTAKQELARSVVPAKPVPIAAERVAVAKAVTPAAPAPAAAPTPPSVTAGPRARLVLQAQADSWADVRDARGNRLLYETILAGHTVAIEGITPLSVFLGNADVVRVEFNGEPYDASRHKRGEIARFTLGEGLVSP